MRQSLSKHTLAEDQWRYRGTGGRSQENGEQGFRPAFLNTETGAVYHSCFADGRPAPLHVLDGLPRYVVLTRSPRGTVLRVKDTVIAGFVRNGRFYTREEAAAESVAPETPCPSL